MSSSLPRMAYFRASAVAHYTSPRRDETVPEFLRFRWSGLLWALVLLSLAWVGWIWSRPIPVISGGLGLTVPVSLAGGEASLTLLLPVSPTLLWAGQPLSCDSGGLVLSGELVAIEPATSVAEARRRFGLGPASVLAAEGTVTVAHARLYHRPGDDLSTLAARGGCEVRLTIGSRPLFTLLRRLAG
jgi:hypothetical protein